MILIVMKQCHFGTRMRPTNHNAYIRKLNFTTQLPGSGNIFHRSFCGGQWWLGTGMPQVNRSDSCSVTDVPYTVEYGQGTATHPTHVPNDSPSHDGDAAVYVLEFAHSFLFCSCVCFCLYGPFSCISFHKSSRQFSAFTLCSSRLISALLFFVFFNYISLYESLPSPDITRSGWVGSKHQLTN